MAVQILPFSHELMPPLRRFVERVFARPRTDAFYHWRYETLPLHRAWLAMRDGEVLAMECAIDRPYRVGSDVVRILEVFDWYCLPELRNSGLGVRVMQSLMKEGPCLLVGGTEDTQGLLPRLKWQVAAQATRVILPLGIERLAAAIQKRMRVPAGLARLTARGTLFWPPLRPHPRARPRHGRAIAVASIGEEIQALYEGSLPYSALPLWPTELLLWLLAGHPSVGHFVPLYFAVGDELVGWSLLRVYSAPDGCDAELVECFAPRPDVDLYTWFVSETAARAVSFGPGMLGACTTCPLLGEALRRNGFLPTGRNPVQLWWPGGGRFGAPVLIGSNSGDSPLVPFAERWW